MEYRTVSTRLSVDEFTLITDYCKRKNTTPSALIKRLIFEEMTPSIPSNIAGKNKISYNKERDNFSWNIELDNGENVIGLENISLEYIRDLSTVLSEALISRDDLQGKKKKNSIPIPRKIAKGKK